tara:strand:+ start:776 stop:1348 length:573 start_codon:yes stop_codon:yes gene_type:complete
MGRQRIYYPRGAQRQGLYTSGGQWMSEDGAEWVGQYHIYTNTGEVFTEPEYVKGKSVKLVPYANLGEENERRTFQYNKIKQIDDYEPTITLPDPYFPQPTGEDYDTGYVVRYFLQKKGSRVIFEVSKDGFSFEDPNYHKCELKWKISGPLNDLNGISGIIDTNQRTVLLKRKEMPFIDSYLTDLTQLAKN